MDRGLGRNDEAVARLLTSAAIWISFWQMLAVQAFLQRSGCRVIQLELANALACTAALDSAESARSGAASAGAAAAGVINSYGVYEECMASISPAPLPARRLDDRGHGYSLNGGDERRKCATTSFSEMDAEVRQLQKQSGNRSHSAVTGRGL